MKVYRDETTGKPYAFVETDAGYREAGERIHELEKLGHRVTGCVDDVKDYLSSSWRETGKYI